MHEYVKAWQCVGCGKIDAPAPCIGICEDRLVEFVYAVEHREALARMQSEAQRADVLIALVRRLANTKPADGQWERSFRALRDEARRTLRAVAAAADAPAARSAAPRSGAAGIEDD